MLAQGLSSGKVDQVVPLIELGVDSLVAVLLRDWAQNEIGVNLPVLKILGGDNAVDLAQYMAELLVPAGKMDAKDGPESDASEKKLLNGGNGLEVTSEVAVTA